VQSLETAKVYVDKEGGCRVFIKHKIVDTLHLKSGDYLRIELDKENKRAIVSKIE